MASLGDPVCRYSVQIKTLSTSMEALRRKVGVVKVSAVNGGERSESSFVIGVLVRNFWKEPPSPLTEWIPAAARQCRSNFTPVNDTSSLIRSLHLEFDRIYLDGILLRLSCA